MPPKKATLEELVTALTDKIDALSSDQKENFTKISDRLDTLETRLKEVTDSNTKLEKDITSLQQENIFLKNKIQDLGQHTRSTNVRIFNFDCNDDIDFDTLIDQLYDRIFLPILRGALSKNRIKTIPSRDRLITSAHHLPGKDGKPKPVICRLLNSHYRTIILQHQKEFGPRAMESVRPKTPGPARPPPLLHPCFEDSTAEMYRFKQQLAAHEAVAAAWIAGGVVRFKLVESDTVRRVKSIYDSIENIIEKPSQ